MKIEIPFHKRFIIPIASGVKVATTRSKRYGNIGDYFYLRDYEGKPTAIKFKLIAVAKERLDEIAEQLFLEEGFSSLEEFKKFWLTIHRKWAPEKRFYLHIFKRI